MKREEYKIYEDEIRTLTRNKKDNAYVICFICKCRFNYVDTQGYTSLMHFRQDRAYEFYFCLECFENVSGPRWTIEEE